MPKFIKPIYNTLFNHTKTVRSFNQNETFQFLSQYLNKVVSIFGFGFDFKTEFGYNAQAGLTLINL